VETPDVQAIRDRLPIEAERDELASRHDAMLPSRQFGEQNVGCAELN
jgi:hypothetical protein